MKRILILTLLFMVAFSATSNAQFGIPTKIQNKYKKVGREKAEEQKTNAEDKGMEEADKHLDKGAEAAEPGIQKAEEAEKKGEEYTLFGLQKYGEFVEGYEADVANKPPEDYKRYAFNSAIVEYRLEGSDEGTKTQYIDMGGYKFATYKVIKKRKTEELSTVILIGSDMISIDYANKSAVKIHNPAAYWLANPNRDWEETGRNMLTHMGYEIVGQETISGKECDIWKQGKSRIWVWNGLTLKSQVGKDVETATSIQIDIPVSGEIFEVPEGYEYEVISASDMFPDPDSVLVKEDEMTEEEWNAVLDEIETMSYSQYKAKVLEEEPEADDEQIKQSYLLLRQQAKRRHRVE
ncbi:MAG: hypothetical protein COW63_05660 [Bacteroidetes bacterium CG18_big_fil_WC_8_21_14_2_50_41_14]|nr:MAG: hypothetical protein COW63_05660 [Bacteroidetes bacterium CG18_big_fil_WC_8_21_14_2_50_41_14]PJB58798.1 MAG: hypothetical protein CO098_06720 [Bacteroidetes bacterium CG_4_9_14_3_um_filter_41_19]